ncbi:MAG: 2Fe-2S iron-sulfur cluster-binding protein [Planctomycetota bacterium]|nr:2Fe-2S iron-sulfur cluster-binding protein [Planctomycetota bacterium]MDI6787232.1 2Fe-2S iron-sulfur cluster-binding protein [Planctomycetota bacterium]
MINLTIDGKPVSVESGATVLDASKKVGIDIPTLCHHEKLLPYGACRLCTVEVTQRGTTRLQASCAYPAEEGIEVKTNTERVIRGRKLMMEFLLARCPNVPAIRKKAEELGVKTPRFSLKDEKCTLCGMCVRVCNEILGVGAIGFADRGIFRRVEPAFDKPSEECLACGACTYVCPTGDIQMETKSRNYWRDKLFGGARDCRYARMGLVSHKVCPNDFQCQKCEVDQRMEDTFGTHPAFVAKPAERKKPQLIEEFILMPGLYYARNHLWFKRLDGKVKIGIDDFTKKVVNRVDNIILPEVGKRLETGQVAWGLRCGSKDLGIRVPLNGEIIDINPDVISDPSLITKDPYQRGWVALVWPKETEWQQTLPKLYSGYKAEQWLSVEAERLYRWSEPQSKVMVADGGRLLPELPQRLNDTQWHNFVQAFFVG